MSLFSRTPLTVLSACTSPRAKQAENWKAQETANAQAVCMGFLIAIFFTFEVFA